MDKTVPKDCDRKVPEKLYRYFPLGSRNKDLCKRIRDILEKSRLYCPARPQLNDPFDCIVKLTYGTDVNSNEYRERREQESAMQGRVDTQTGILSFSESRDNILAWSHYANSHYGLCLEFDMKRWTKEQYACHIDKVDYSIGRPLVTADLNEQGDGETLKKIAFTKHKDWIYEKEWRMLPAPPPEKNGDRYLEFPKDALTGVIFGLRTEDADRRAIEQVIKATGYQNLTLYEAREDHDRFSVNIVRVQPTKT